MGRSPSAAHGVEWYASRLLGVSGLALLAVVAALAAAQTASASTIFVGANLTDNATAHMWDTVAEGLADAAPGDTVQVFDGNYTEHVTITDASLVLEGESRNGTVLQLSSSAWVVLTVHAANVIIRNITLSSPGQSITTYGSTADNSNGTIENVTFASGGNCLWLVSANWTIRDTEFTNCDWAITLRDTANGTRMWAVSVAGASICIEVGLVRGLWIYGLNLSGCTDYAMRITMAADVHLSRFSINVTSGQARGISMWGNNQSAMSFDNGSIYDRYQPALEAKYTSHLRLDNLTVEDGSNLGIQIGIGCTNWTLRNTLLNATDRALDFLVPSLYDRGPVLTLTDFQHDIDRSNTIRGQPLIYINNASNVSYDGPAEFLMTVNSTGLNISITNELKGSGTKFIVIYTSASTFRGIRMNYSSLGLAVEYSNDNLFLDTNLTSSTLWVHASSRNRFEGGTWISYSNVYLNTTASLDNSVMRSNVFSNITCSDTPGTCFYFGWQTYETLLSNVTISNASYGVYAYNPDSFFVRNSSFSQVQGAALFVDNSAGGSGKAVLVENTSFGSSPIGAFIGRNHDGSSVDNCTFFNVTRSLIFSRSAGARVQHNSFDTTATSIEFANSSSGTVVENTFRNVTGSLLTFDSTSGGSKAYHNNFFANPSQTSDGGTGNVYDNGYPSGGNYWENSLLTDRFGGATQNIGGPDGIVDAALNLGSSKKDYYPLAEPWPPRLTLVAPPNGSVLVAGSVIDFNVSYYFDTVQFAPNGSTAGNLSAPWDIDAATLPDGTITLTVWANDSTGLRATLTLFFIDHVPPAINASSPAPGGVYPQGTLLRFRVWGASAATWSLGAGSFPLPAPYAIDTALWGEGEYNVTISATDANGWERSASFRYMIDAALPDIAPPPWEGTYIEPGTLLSLSASDTYFAWLRWNAGAGRSDNRSQPTASIDTTGWPDGVYAVTVEAADLAGQVSRRVFTVTVDSGAPVIVLLSPLNGSFVRPGTNINFTVAEPNLLEVSWARGVDAPSPASPQGAYYRVPTDSWGSGNWTVHLLATDRVGHSAHLDFALVTDGQPPDLSSLKTDVAVDEDKPLDLDGRAVTDGPNPLPLSAISWRFGPPGSATVVGPTATYTWDTPGIYAVVVTVTDLAGNMNQTTLRITVVDRTPPTINVAPLPVFNEGDEVAFDARTSADNDPAGPASITFEWTFDYEGSQRSLSGAARSFAFQVPGMYAVTLRATDAQGNSNATTFEVRINDVPSLGAPLPDIFTLPGTYEVTLDIVDGDAGDTHNVIVKSPQTMSAVWLAGQPVLRFTPARPGVYPVNFSISDGWSRVYFAFNLTVRELRPPSFRPGIANYVELVEGKESLVPVSGWVTDPDDGANVTFEVTVLDSSIAAAVLEGDPGNISLRITAKQAGSTSITLRVRDPSGAVATTTIQVVVDPAPSPAAPPQSIAPFILAFLVAAVVAGVIIIWAVRRKKSAPGAPPQE